MKFKNKTEFILALLYSPDQLFNNNAPIDGITRLEKLVFLAEKETDMLKDISPKDDFKFIPYLMGPFSPEIYDEIDFLESMGLIQSNKSGNDKAINSVEEDLFFNDQILDKYQKSEPIEFEEAKQYKLSPKGIEIAKKIFENLPDNDKSYLIKLKKEFNNISLKQFLRYVYKKYPEFTSNSEIKKYLGF